MFHILLVLLLSFSVSLKLLRSLMLCYSQLILVLFALFFCVSWCGGNVLLVMFQFTLKSLDCIGWFEWIRLLLSLLYRIDFVDVFLLMPKYTLFFVGYSSRCPFVQIDLDFLFLVLFVMNHKTSMSILIFECFVPYAMFHCLLYKSGIIGWMSVYCHY